MLQQDEKKTEFYLLDHSVLQTQGNIANTVNNENMLNPQIDQNDAEIINLSNINPENINSYCQESIERPKIKKKTLPKTNSFGGSRFIQNQNPSKIIPKTSNIFGKPKLEGVKDHKESQFAQIILENARQKYVKELWNNNFLIIAMFVKKFIETLKSINIVSKFLRMTKYHYNIIDDKVYFYDSIMHSINHTWMVPTKTKKFDFNIVRVQNLLKTIKKTRSCIKILMKFCSQHLPVIAPDRTMRLVWDYFIVIFMTLNFFYIPLEISFDFDISPQKNWIEYLLIKIIPVWIFFIDIGVHLLTAYYSKGVYIFSKSKILYRYMKNDLFLDSISLVPFAFAIYFQSKFVQLFFIIRVFNLKNIVNNLNEYNQLNEKIQGIIDLIKLLFIITFLSHLIACIWHYLAIIEIDQGISPNWLSKYYLLDYSWQDRYIYSLYWSLTTMITIGYGDIVPTNSNETIFAVFIMVISSGVFGYCINGVGEILQNMYRKEEEFKMKMRDLQHYMNKRNLNKMLQMRVKRYLEYMFQEENEGFQRGHSILTLLSKKLHQDVKVEIYGKILKDMYVFKKYFSEEFIAKCSTKFKEITYAPEDIIFSENDKEDKGIYYIMRGEVELYFRDTQKNFKALKKGDHFGEYAFFSGQNREMSARSCQVTQLAYLSFQDFLETLKEFSLDYEIYCFLKDDVNIYSNFARLEMKCFSCNKYDHITINCPLIRYIPTKSAIIKRHIIQNTQIRQIFTRKTKLSIHALMKKFELNKKIIAFQDKNIATLENYEKKMLILERHNEDNRRQGIVVPNGNSYNLKSESNINIPKNSLSRSRFSSNLTESQMECKETDTNELKIDELSYKSDEEEEDLQKEELIKRNTISTIDPYQSLIAAAKFQEIINKTMKSPLKKGNVGFVIPESEEDDKTSEKNNNLRLSLKKCANDDFSDHLGKIKLKKASDTSSEENEDEGENDKNANKNYGDLTMDTIKIYKVYFPHNNVNEIFETILNIEKIKQRRIKRKKNSVYFNKTFWNFFRFKNAIGFLKRAKQVENSLKEFESIKKKTEKENDTKGKEKKSHFNKKPEELIEDADNAKKKIIRQIRQSQKKDSLIHQILKQKKKK